MDDKYYWNQLNFVRVEEYKKLKEEKLQAAYDFWEEVYNRETKSGIGTILPLDIENTFLKVE